MIIAIDEAQELRRVNWLRFDRLFAYIFDNLPNIRLALSVHRSVSFTTS